MCGGTLCRVAAVSTCWSVPSAALRALLTHRPLMSLRRFGAFLRPFSAACRCDWKSQSPPARKCPFIPRGHLSMCLPRAASLFTLNSSRRPCDDAYPSASPRFRPGIAKRRTAGSAVPRWRPVFTEFSRTGRPRVAATRRTAERYA